MERARRQHARYVTALRQVVPVFSLPALEGHPDCCFVEDTVVAIQRRAVITRLGHASRRGEAESVRTVLEYLGMEVLDMQRTKTATCDGGDVLWSGRHLFVGLSNRTNAEGTQFLSQAFSDLAETIVVPPVVQGDQVLHLKSAVTLIDDSTLVAPSGPAGDQVLQAMQANDLGYKAIRLPDVLACNLVSCNGWLLVQDTRCQESRETLEQAALDRGMQLIYVDTSELAKKDAALTCCSVLLSC